MMDEKSIESQILDLQDQIKTLEKQIQSLLGKLAEEKMKIIWPILEEHYG